MRQGPHPKRLRGRGGRKNSNPRNQTFDSNGPEVRVRGNAQQVVEKYLSLARDASSAGDRIAAESYFQHAEHYYRIMTANGGGESRDSQPMTPSGNPVEAGREDTEQPDIAGSARNGNGGVNGANGVTAANGVAEAPEDDSQKTPIVNDGDAAQA